MSKYPSLLEFIQEQLTVYEKKYGPLSNTDRKFLLLGVEFDSDHFPEVLMNRSVGDFTTQMAGFGLLEDMIADDRQRLKEKLNNARSRGTESQPSKSSSVPPPEIRPEVEDFLKALRDKLKAVAKKEKPIKHSEEDAKIEEVLKNIKNQFGFDGKSTHTDKGFDIENIGGRDDDDD